MAIFIGQNGTLGLARRSGGTSFVYSSSQVVQPGQWYHVAASFDAAQMRLYVNGRSTELREQPFELPETQGGFFIGGVDPQRLPVDQNDRFFHGMIESVRVTDGVRYAASFEPALQLISDEKTLAAFSLHQSAVSSSDVQSDLANRHTLRLQDTEWIPQSGL
jgi:hypothetical protein